MKDLAASDIDASHIELTEAEKQKVIAAALHEALSAKRSSFIQSEYWKRVNNPAPPPVFTAEKFMVACIQKWEKQTGLHYIKSEANQKALILLSLYFSRDEQFLQANEHYSFDKGIYLYGPVGCGKTEMMRMFCDNPLSNYIVISARKVAAEFARGGEDGKGGYPAIERYFGVYVPETYRSYFKHKEIGFCFDDLGTETEKQNFGNKSNVLGEIILNRYDQFRLLKSKTHITSNLSANEIEEAYGVRVRSRMREMFNIIHFPVNAPDLRQ